MKNDPDRHYRFQNLQEKQMTFHQVFEHIMKFMRAQPTGNYRLIVGTDSQVHPEKTVFITGVVIRNKGKGLWACIRKVIVPRKMLHLHERMSYEIALSEEIVSLFTEERKKQLIDIVFPHIYQGASFKMEGHIDIGAGKKNKTSKFVNEMVNRMDAIGVEPKIKPNAFVASSYANRYTK